MPACTSGCMRDGILLAEATINGTIAVRSCDVEEVSVAAGEPFIVCYHYKVYEASFKEESWRFRLTANLHGEETAVSEMNHADRRVFRDDVWANLRQEHVCPEPGEYTLDFVAEAEMSRRPWKETGPPGERNSKEVKGRVRIKAV